MTDVHFSWKQLDGIVNPYKSTTGVVTITPLRYSYEDNTLITDASVNKRVDGDYTFKLPPNSPGTFYQFRLVPNEGSTVIEYRLVPDGTAFEYVDLALVDGEANHIDDPSVPPWIAELEALKKSGDFFVTQVESALDVASDHSAKAEQYAANANASATDAESSAKKALEQASYISAKVELATGSAEESKASAAKAFSSAEDARTSYESSVQLAGVMGETVTEVGVIRDQAAASAAEAESSETNAGSSASSAKADADRAALNATNSSKYATAADASAKAASSATKSEQEAVKAIDAASTLNADATAFGDAVRSGTFKGDAGPANQLDVIETKTVSADTPASVTISGETPNQHLSFSIPRGKQGDKGDRGDRGVPGALTNASTYHIVGPGRPDIPSSTAGTITGNEPVGATYYSEDGADVGAHGWRRRPGGKWEVTDGDTGWRTLQVLDGVSAAHLATNKGGTATSGSLGIRRVGTTIYLLGYWYNLAGAPGTRLWSLPTGWRLPFMVPGGGYGIQEVARWPGSNTSAWTITNGQYLNITTLPGGELRIYGSWVTADSWPTFPLPGTPA